MSDDSIKLPFEHDHRTPSPVDDYLEPSVIQANKQPSLETLIHQALPSDSSPTEPKRPGTQENNQSSPEAPATVQRLGILGGGQLGRMTAQAAQKLGLSVHIYTPEKDSPASQVADFTTVAHWTDTAALQAFAQSVDVITLEFENIPVEAANTLSKWAPIYPQPSILGTTQNRWLEKSFLAQHGIPVAPFAFVSQPEQLEAAGKQVDYPLVLKTVHSGYDGKGQERANNIVALRCAFAAVGNVPCVVEKFLPLEREISVIAARDAAGNIEIFPPFENQHRNHILDITITPAHISKTLAQQARDLTVRIMNALGIQGLLCVEFFVEKNGQLLVNELAPRPHNSGHLTMEAGSCSQFEQLVRAVTGMELASCRSLQPAAMANIMGDLWKNGEPNWAAIEHQPGVNLHLYGKSEARVGRKMGHLTATAGNAYEAERRVYEARKALTQKP